MLKGSSVVQPDGLLNSSTKRKVLWALLRNPDPVFVTALLVMEIPSVLMLKMLFDQVKDGQIRSMQLVEL